MIFFFNNISISNTRHCGIQFVCPMHSFPFLFHSRIAQEMGDGEENWASVIPRKEGESER